MRYVLGMSSYNKETKERWEGIATINDILGLYPSVLKIETIKNKLDSNKTIITRVYNNIDDIQKVISDYAIRFRRDDVWDKKQIWKKSKYIFNFYPIKVDSSKFPFKIEKNKSYNSNVYNLENRG